MTAFTIFIIWLLAACVAFGLGTLAYLAHRLSHPRLPPADLAPAALPRARVVRNA